MSTFGTLPKQAKKVLNEIEVPLIGTAIKDEAMGDQIGISKKGNILWFVEDIDLDDIRVQDFIENFFTHPIRVSREIERGIK